MDDQKTADLMEAEAIARYLAMRAAWGSCWGRRPRSPAVRPARDRYGVAAPPAASTEGP
jgi:hypothetical protein